jgi:hypothetical protein
VQYDWEYVELGRRFAIVIIPAEDEDGRELLAVWLKQLKTGAINWDFILQQGSTFLDDNVSEEFLLTKTLTVDIAEDYAVRLSNRLNLRVFRIENDYLRGSHRIIEHIST